MPRPVATIDEALRGIMALGVEEWRSERSRATKAGLARRKEKAMSMQAESLQTEDEVIETGGEEELEGPEAIYAEGEWIELCPGLLAQVIPITPGLATRWLERNHPDNRTMTPDHINGMVYDIQHLKYRLTHEAIAFNGRGCTIDGQHRLTAIVKAGVTVKMLVIWNAGSDIRDPINQGRRRNLGYITGLPNNVKAAVGCLRGLEIGREAHASLTVAASDDVLEKHGAGLTALRENVPKHHKLIGGVIAACVWALPIDEEGVLDFARKVSTGEMLGSTDPAFAYRNWKERNKGVDTWEVALAVLNCVRYHLHGLPLTSVYTGDSGYRAITSQRRVLKVTNTPTTALVESMSFRPQLEANRASRR